jgi:hypothetical protein
LIEHTPLNQKREKGEQKMKWQKRITKKELKHVKEMCGGTLQAFKQTREQQRKDKARNPDIEPCWDCRRIARKLGLEGNDEEKLI